MLHKLKNITLAALMSASFAYADGGAIFDIKVGAGVWEVDAPVGQFGQTEAGAIDLTSDFGVKDGTANYMWAEFQHGIPLIPHIRVEYAAMDFTGSKNSTFTFGPYTYAANLESTLRLDNVDAIAFWDIGVGDMFDFNFGVGAKIIAGELIGTEYGTGLTQTAPIGAAAVYGYVNPRVELPLGFGVDVAYKWYPGGLEIDGDIEFTELIAKVDYTLEWAIFKLGAEVGYRSMDLTLNLPTDQLYIHTELSGAFAGVFLKIGI